MPATTAVDTAFLHCGGRGHRQMTGKLPYTHTKLRSCRQHCCIVLASACCGGILCTLLLQWQVVLVEHASALEAVHGRGLMVYRGSIRHYTHREPLRVHCSILYHQTSCLSGTSQSIDGCQLQQIRCLRCRRQRPRATCASLAVSASQGAGPSWFPPSGGCGSIPAALAGVIRAPYRIAAEIQVVLFDVDASSTWPVSCVLYFTHSPGPCTG